MHLPIKGLSPDVTQIISTSWRASTTSSYATPSPLDDGWTSAADGSLIPTNCKSSPWFFAHIWIRAKLQYYWETTKCNKCNSRDPRRPPTRGTLASVSVYESSLSPETCTTKVHQDIGCQQGIILSEKSWTNGSFSLKQLKFKIAVLLTILAGRRTHTLDMLSVVHMDQSHDNVIFHIIGLTTCSSPSRPNRSVVYRTYMQNEYFVQLNVFVDTWRSEIVTQDFTEVFIT